MRERERIDRMVHKLREAWVNSPDLRLGQLVEVAANRGLGNEDDDDIETFYLEDNIMELGLDRLLKRGM